MATFVIDTAVSGNNTIVAGVTGKIIRVTSLVLVCAGTVTVQWFSGATKLSGAMPFVANTGYALSSPPGLDANRQNPYLQTLAGDNLILALGGNVQVSGHGTYL